MTITITGGMTFTGGVSATVGPPVTATYLVVAGGGGGGSAGGGGGGGLVAGSITLGSGSNYTVTVAAGGAGGASKTNGGDTTALGFTAMGGGSGGGYSSANPGISGGSGGGGGIIPIPPGSGTVAGGSSIQNSTYGYGVGFAGGTSTSDGSTYNGSGGGGAGAVGNNGVSSAGAGGAGYQSSITGTNLYWAGGGGGGCQLTSVGGAGGLGGGGGGSQAFSGTGGAGGGSALNSGATGGVSPSNGGAGGANTGGGGGGGAGSNTSGGNGGSGVVIVSYAGAPQFSGGVITSSGGNTIHTFYTSGTLQSGAALMTNSLRFRNSATTSLNRTPAAAGNRQVYTISLWTKRGILGSEQDILMVNYFSGTTTYDRLFFNTDNTLYFDVTVSNTIAGRMNTTAVYRDPASWYHIVIAVDTTQATASNRYLIYVNGVQVTSFGTATYPTQNLQASINNNVYHGIGYGNGVGSAYDGEMTDFYFIDGQQLTPSSFAATNSTTGVWQPASYTGTYGTNGFHLPFTKTTATAALGTDTSGNNNTFTVNNFSLTSGVTYDSVADVPTLTNASVSNYCVYNPLNNNGTITNGGLRFSNTAGTYASCSGTMGMSNGKYYWEVTITAYSPSGTLVGITASTEVWTGVASYIGSTTGSYGYYNGGTKYNNAASASYGSSWTTGDIIGVTYDTSTGTLTFYKNNVSQGTAYSGLTGTFMPGVSAYNNGTPLLDINFGQQPFVYTPPLGYLALNAYNM